MEEMSHRLQYQSINECVKGNLWQQESDNPARRDGSKKMKHSYQPNGVSKNQIIPLAGMETIALNLSYM